MDHVRGPGRPSTCRRIPAPLAFSLDKTQLFHSGIIEGCEKQGDLIGRILPVAVERDHDGTLGQPDALANGGGLSAGRVVADNVRHLWRATAAVRA